MADNDNLSSERFGFTVFLSACIHAMIILGVGFSYLEELNSEPALEITLAQFSSEIAPDNPDYLAQENQLGSGSLEDKAAPSSPFESDFNDETIREVPPIPQTPASSEQLLSQDIAVLTSFSQGDIQIRQQLDQSQSDQQQLLSEQTSPAELSLAIASLQAQLDIQRQAYAKRPRRYTISSASTQKSYDALYLDSWRKRIETIGNLNYPENARIQALYGNLRLLVSILPDGTIDEVRILQSSGQAVLDQAAINIVHLASPFEPFPEELRGKIDILEVIRTWRFHEGNAFSSY
ncbi:MAG: hypothetical protein COC19_03165 [SAR86 cluster bacterium]|uniref:TonB C-terminal domain-containing protein n=1 Tax=SAR86 cluster bacterium TaxID=2030880 RepID=A0A2A4MR57_9GAMM|nr:MAG: hypothetical protein COC19_03165 [SAR86 cluster bacterium]